MAHALVAREYTALQSGIGAATRSPSIELSMAGMDPAHIDAIEGWEAFNQEKFFRQPSGASFCFPSACKRGADEDWRDRL
jgi:hypothetical protein